jgi:stage V sporulation protein SpoVS
MDKPRGFAQKARQEGYVMRGDLIVVFGGSGFIGRHVVKALCKRGKRVRVPMRRPHLGADLRVLGDVGQVQLVQANVRFPDSVTAALDGADGVVNLIGLLSEKGKQTFIDVQAKGAAAIADAAKARGITRFVHVPIRTQSRSMAAPKRMRKLLCARLSPPRPFCAPPSCSARKTTFSTASPTWRSSPPHCR